jgi:hypothetical protein
MLTGPNRTLTWTAANMPASVAEPGKSLAFAYDTERSRIRQVVNSSGTETTTYWNDPTTGAKAEYVDGSATTLCVCRGRDRRHFHPRGAEG